MTRADGIRGLRVRVRVLTAEGVRVIVGDAESDYSGRCLRK